jgi:hypothetical protein
MTPQLISVQGFAFRGRPLSILVACASVRSHLFRFSRRSLHLALQSPARRNKTGDTLTKKRTVDHMLINRSFFTWVKTLLSQPLFLVEILKLFAAKLIFLFVRN